MDRGVVIVNSNGEVFSKEMSNDNDNHCNYIRKYLKENNYSIENLDSLATYHLYVLCAKLNLIALQIDTITVIYLPKSLSKEQFNWYLENRKNIKKISNLSIVDIDEDEQLMLYDRVTLDGDNPYKKFKDLMEEKKVYDVKEEEHGRSK